MRVERRICAAVILTFFAVFSVAACKGGSSLVGLRFRGVISGSNAKAGSPIAGMLVTVVATGESDSTTSDGTFDISSSTFEPVVELRFAKGAFNESITIGEIPDNTEDVVVTLAFDEVNQALSVVSITLIPAGNLTTTSTTTTTTTIPGTPPGSPTPRPTATPRPTEKPRGPFDADGNTSEFGIPNGLKGNISAGRRVWSRVCTDCHLSEKTGKSYGDIQRARRTVPDMRGLQVSNQQVADVVAYLNRNRRN
jgi:hypothetical protein